MEFDNSITIENYLKGIFKFSKEGKPASTSSLAKHLESSPASVTEMLKKLHEKGLVIYKPYKGALLSPTGRLQALGIIRKHRLWEVFLLNVLEFTWDEVHETAEQLEHIKSPLLINKLDKFLGFPKYDPHGDPIPSETGEFTQRNTKNLSKLVENEEFTMVGVLNHDPKYLRFLDRIGLNINTKGKIIERIDYENSLNIQLNNTKVVISGEIAKWIIVQ